MTQRPNEPSINFKDLVSLAMERALEAIEEIFDQDAKDPFEHAPKPEDSSVTLGPETELLTEAYAAYGSPDYVTNAGVLDASALDCYVIGTEVDGEAFAGHILSVQHEDTITRLVLDTEAYSEAVPFELKHRDGLSVWAPDSIS